jgi:DNA repair exonuclease SbcCD ATPase subunit
MEKKQQQQQQDPYLFDLTQDDEESFDVTTISVDKCSIPKLTCFETGNNNNRLQLKKCAINLDSDASSDCVLVLSPEIDKKQISNNNNTLVTACTNNEKNLSEDEKLKTSVARRQCADDAGSDDDLWLQRPAFASSVTGSTGGGYSSYFQDTKVAYSDSGNNSKGCVTIISTSSAITMESSKAEAKERRQQLRESEKQQKALEKESARLQQAYEKEQKQIERERLKRQRKVEKEQKQQDRKRLQQEKQQLKDREKLERQKCLLEDQQEQGKFAQQEICIRKISIRKCPWRLDSDDSLRHLHG